MTDPSDDSSNPAAWLRFAREDLAASERLTVEDDTVPRIAGYLAQQAAEKALKAVLVG
jgi:HEPN domain-containing protein